MAADCNKPIWSLHLNSKCEISSLAKRRRRRRRCPFALAPSGGVCVSVCVCALCVNVPSRKCQLLCLCAPSATCSSSVGPWRHKGHKPRLELQCLFLLLLLSVRLSICLIWVYATFMLINTFMTCATVSSPFSFPPVAAQVIANLVWISIGQFGLVSAPPAVAKPSQATLESVRSEQKSVNLWGDYGSCE